MADYKIPQEVVNVRKPDHAIQPYLLGRWSPRSMTGESISDEELMSLLEAARWAPSSFNEQPWEIIYAKRGTPQWDTLFALLIEKNQVWAKDGAVLFMIISRNTFAKNGKPSSTHSYDTGAAWMALALEGAARGLVTHGMSGFDHEKAIKDLKIPEGLTVEAMAVVGKRAPKEKLPEAIRSMEVPNQRRAIKTFIHEGKFTRG